MFITIYINVQKEKDIKHKYLNNPKTLYTIKHKKPTENEMTIKINVCKNPNIYAKKVGKNILLVNNGKSFVVSEKCKKVSPVNDATIMLEISISNSQINNGKCNYAQDCRKLDNSYVIDYDEANLYDNTKIESLTYILTNPYDGKNNSLLYLVYFNKHRLVDKFLKDTKYDKQLINYETCDGRTLLTECLEYGMTQIIKSILPYVNFAYLDVYNRPYITLMKIYNRSELIQQHMIDASKIITDAFGKTYYDY